MPTARAPEPVFALPVMAESASEESAGFSVVQILTIALAYWKQTVIIVLTVSILAAVGLKFMPKTYTAIATLIVNTDNKDPLAGQQLSDPLANFVATQTELMLSPVILLPVVDRLDLTSDPGYGGRLRAQDPTAARETAEKALAAALMVETGRGGQLLYINASAKDPMKAAAVANAVADVFLEQQRQRLSQPAGERAQRYSEELAELRLKTAAAQDKVTEFRKRNGMTDVASNADDSETRALATLQTQLLDAQNRRRALESEQAGQQSTANEALASTQITGLKTQISDLEAQLAERRPTLGARHPQVLELMSRLEADRRSLAAAVDALGENKTTELSRTRELEDKLTRAVAEQREKVLQLHQLEGEGEKLTLELESAQAVYKRALDGYDQIMFASVGNHTNVSIISRATPPLKASKPNKPKLLAVAVLFGLALGFCVPIGYELFVNRRLRCRDDIERDFGVPVLALFDAIPAPADAA